MSCARGVQRRESDEETCIYSFSSFIFLGGPHTHTKLKGNMYDHRVKRLFFLLKKTRRGKISSLFVRRARSLLESALIGREEHDDAVVKVVGEEEEEVDKSESEKKSREDQQQQQQEQTCRGKR